MNLRLPLLFGAGLALAGCATPPAPAPEAAPAMPVAAMAEPVTNEEKLIAAIAANGCEMNIANTVAITSQTGLTDSEMAQAGATLEASGRADASEFGRFRLTTGPCA